MWRSCWKSLLAHLAASIPPGHAAIYLSRVCADSLFSLRRCGDGEQGVVISRYHRIAGYDWLAIPLIPYLYAIDRPDQVPRDVSRQDVAALRDDYRRRHLEDVAPDEKRRRHAARRLDATGRRRL